MYVKCSEQVTHCKCQALSPLLLVTSRTPRTTRSTAYGPAHSTFHNTARKIFTIRIFTRPLPSHRIFKLLHAYVKNWSSKVLFQVLLSTEMKVYIFFDASGTEKKKEMTPHFWLRDKQEGKRMSGLLFALLEQNALNCLPVTTLLKWIFHSIHYPLRKEIIVACVGIYFLSCCNLEDSDSVHFKLGKHKERYYQVKKSFVSVPVFMESSLAFLCNIFCSLTSVPTLPLKLCLLSIQWLYLPKRMGTSDSDLPPSAACVTGRHCHFIYSRNLS